ncbi:PIN domain-containing protein [Leptolyngbya boryana CZ1]|uniref:PIN domain-containing protein n=1 Tax=Leptolyngbya boryana CZ1 TaxID=3060204 RepID=A0AA96WW76_LEPBY|nr:PIN domain-containing protein [Leptolyngbya boryana]WNZ46722.1 PIN domain-containing protein [Leptolyngbya boryana CZ1]
MTAILDTNFLFALSDRSDRNHSRVLAVARTLQDRLILPTVVIPEASYLIGSRLGHKAMRSFLTSLTTSDLQIESLLIEDLVRVTEILEQYADSQLDFVDAAIVALAERLSVTRILSLDRRDFSIIRPQHCEYFELLP